MGKSIHGPDRGSIDFPTGCGAITSIPVSESKPPTGVSKLHSIQHETIQLRTISVLKLSRLRRKNVLSMAFTSNIKAFLNPAIQDPLSRAYCMLVAIELALKDASFTVSGGGHDVPGMLQLAANAIAGSPATSAQLNSLSLQLKNALGAITCQGKNGHPTHVPPVNYPYLRYTRRSGDWGGINETPANSLSILEAVCQNLRAFLIQHRTMLGVQL